MKSTHRMKENMTHTMLEKKLRLQDQLELPMDDAFFENLHDQIMQSVEKTEVKPLSRWSKTWVFLEKKAKPHLHLLRKAVKTGFVAATVSMAIGLMHISAKIYSTIAIAQEENNQLRIVKEVEQNPAAWSDLVISYQSENDFYADVLSRRNDLGTIVEIDRALSQSL